jgi:hypothetical protein
VTPARTDDGGASRGAHAAAAAKRAKRVQAEAFAAELRGTAMFRRREASYRNWTTPEPQAYSALSPDEASQMTPGPPSPAPSTVSSSFEAPLLCDWGGQADDAWIAGW